MIADNPAALDLFSTSQTTCASCSYSAPYFAAQKTSGRWFVIQGCCNHWDCPRCGQLRAKQEYGRIVEGCRTLIKDNKLAFITITCLGGDTTVKEAEEHYLEWTNRFFSSARQKAQRAGSKWCYVQVTERQKRAHPHSHILSTFYPSDIVPGVVEKWERDTRGNLSSYWHEADRSDWLQEAVQRAGLGDQYDISIVDKVEGASRYVAKYLFKKSMFKTDWPKGWKRVRYSQSFPKLPKHEGKAFVLLTRSDWQRLSTVAVVVDAGDLDTYEYVTFALHGSDTIVNFRPPKGMVKDAIAN